MKPVTKVSFVCQDDYFRSVLCNKSPHIWFPLKVIIIVSICLSGKMAMPDSFSIIISFYYTNSKCIALICQPWKQYV